MTAVTICCDLGAQENKICHCFHCFPIYAEYIMLNAWLDESQPGIKISGRNINSLRYANDTTVMAESEEELKSLLMREKKKKN